VCVLLLVQAHTFLYFSLSFFVIRRQATVLASAKRSNAIVGSLFPAGVRDRLMDGDGEGINLESLLPKDFLPMQTQKARIQSYLTGDPTSDNMKQHGRPEAPSNILGSEPIADFFPATTILFADLAGFTAWSSSREPSQVFMLLETLYGAMDKAARRLGVFKVETVGDCYVAATGIPDPRDDHAVLMVRFARSCLEKIKDLTDHLESALGPGTADLAMRMGIHSGPVTAGVLRGEKSRFQLFGDTMNTAARMESAGTRKKVHMSKETADLLIAAGKGSWLEERGESIVAKGKGQLVTFWLKEKTGRRFSTSIRDDHVVQEDGGDPTEASSVDDASEHSTSDYPMTDAMKAVKADIEERRRQGKTGKTSWDNTPYDLQRMDRLVDYNADVLIGLLKKIVARRSVVRGGDLNYAEQSTHGKIALDEIKELIEMPKYNAEAAVKMASEATIEIPGDVRSELRNYIRRVANSYNLNPFHNFEHASHVALSVNKLMKRIVMPDDVDYRRNTKQNEVDKVIAVSKDLHQATLGISSDPATQFACVFVALIHDAGHTGVPNHVVAQEEPALAEKYRNKSLAEQRSIDIAWGILMEDSYENLRRCMFPSVAELKHFRQLIVNSVMATDIFDKELSALRKARWQKCFHPEEAMFHAEESKEDAFNRKATIVIEHIIQASDVAHTMQHWHVYQKWNERLFTEMYTAYKDGRQDSDPAAGWYKGELWFFDNYVIPLARKLHECGVFGVSSSEYLNYAVENRNEWQRKGEAIVEKLTASVKKGEMSGEMSD
jgi:class 3 adenylate cyclase